MEITLPNAKKCVGVFWSKKAFIDLHLNIAQVVVPNGMLSEKHANEMKKTKV